MKTPDQAIRMQKILVSVSILLFLIKIAAWRLTGSVAILTDALESTVNVVAGFVGLYSIILSKKPKDKEHPYGHGKIEFVSSAFEGALITVAGLIIVYESLDNLVHPHELQQLDLGIILVAATALVNYILGHICMIQGKKVNSPVLISGGSHLKSDTYSTLGILVGIGLIMLTGLKWIDSLAALIFAFIIILTGFGIIRRSLSGIMDESDDKIITEIVEQLNKHRREDWVDVHNMRVINYSGFYHIDCHLTVPYYVNVNEAHKILDSLTEMFSKHFDNRVEFFVHVDGCLKDQCSLCSLSNCPKRSSPFVNHIEWTNENVILNSKHFLK